MGTHFVTAKFSAINERELKEEFRAYQDEKSYEDGHDNYSGHMGLARGLIVTNHFFKTDDKACEWLDTNCMKSDSAKAVRVGDSKNVFPQTAKDKALVTSYESLSKEIKDWDANLIKRTKSAKSLFKGCEKCQSRICVKFINTISCPVCGSFKFLQTATDDKKLVSLKTRFASVNKSITEAKSKKSEVYWLVGANVSS